MTSMSKDGLLCNVSAALLKASCGKGRASVPHSDASEGRW